MPNSKSIKTTVNYLALGDSYTIGESVPEKENFPNQLSQRLSGDSVAVSQIKIIAKTGWTTKDLLDAMGAENLKDTFQIVTLLIGVNNQYQQRDTGEYAEQFKTLVKQSVTIAGGIKARVSVLSIPDYGYTPFGEGDQKNISQQIDVFNNINKRITLEEGICYYNITRISRNRDPLMVANDGLHPSVNQYKLWVDLMYDQIKSSLH